MGCWEERHHFLSRLGERLSVNWERNYPQVMEWVRADVSFAVLRATFLFSGRSCARWRSLGVEDAALIEWLTAEL